DLDPRAFRQADYERVERLMGKIATLTAPNAPFAATARACLEANSLSFLVKRPEENNIAA
ncbi:MAG: hypothetical protein V7703_15450, partial [Hyphomicrobiales bacterium]